MRRHLLDAFSASAPLKVLAALSVSAAALAQLSQRYVRPVMFVSLGFDSGTQYLHDAIGPYVWGGQTWQGTGDFGSVEMVEEGQDLSPYGVTLRLSGIDASLATEALTGDYVLSAVALYAGFVDSGNVLVADPDLIWSGTMDTIDVNAGDESG